MSENRSTNDWKKNSQEQTQQAHRQYLEHRKQQFLQQRTQQALFRQQLKLRHERMQQRFAQWQRAHR